MTELDERLKLLDRMEPPDLWADIRSREPRRPASPEGRGRVVAVFAAAVVAAGGIALLARAFLGGTPKPSSQPFHPAAKANGVVAFVRGTRGPNSGIYVIQPDGTSAAGWPQGQANTARRRGLLTGPGSPSRGRRDPGPHRFRDSSPRPPTVHMRAGCSNAEPGGAESPRGRRTAAGSPSYGVRTSIR